eukprot:jgi/Bigna1/132039/aug1.16_g6747
MARVEHKAFTASHFLKLPLAPTSIVDLRQCEGMTYKEFMRARLKKGDRRDYEGQFKKRQGSIHIDQIFDKGGLDRFLSKQKISPLLRAYIRPGLCWKDVQAMVQYSFLPNRVVGNEYKDDDDDSDHTNGVCDDDDDDNDDDDDDDDGNGAVSSSGHRNVKKA